jgi:hypothetical protein
VPLAPQVEFEGVVQTPLAQHPPQLEPPQLQAPALQAWPLAHGPHLLPPSPHAAVDCALTRTQVSF